MERKLGGCLMDKPKSLLYQDGGSNLCLSLEDIGPGWRSKPQADYQVYTPYLAYTQSYVCFLLSCTVSEPENLEFAYRKSRSSTFGIQHRTTSIVRSHWNGPISQQLMFRSECSQARRDVKRIDRCSEFTLISQLILLIRLW